MFKILFSLIFISGVANASIKTLACEEKGELFFTFGLTAKFEGPNLVGEMTVSDRNNFWDHKFNFPIQPRSSHDKVKGVEKSEFYTHFEYKLGSAQNCTYFLNLPVDLIEYQTYSPNLSRSLVGNYTIVYPNTKVHIEKVMECQFVDATGVPKN